MGKCKLCGKKRKLCNQSHIIPNFMYQGLFDHDNKMHSVKSNNGELKKIGKRQTGEFQKNILCEQCDNALLGNLESYASSILYQKDPPTIKNYKTKKGMKYTYCAGLDYNKFKLFLLSILWRSSISDRKFFENVKLGPHEDIIREMFLNNKPGNQLKYPCLIMTYLNLDKPPKELVTQPTQARINGGYIYKFLIGGMIYIYFVSDHIIPNFLKRVSINSKGEIKIIHTKYDQAKMIIGSMIGIKF